MGKYFQKLFRNEKRTRSRTLKNRGRYRFELRFHGDDLGDRCSSRSCIEMLVKMRSILKYLLERSPSTLRWWIKRRFLFHRNCARKRINIGSSRNSFPRRSAISCLSPGSSTNLFPLFTRVFSPLSLFAFLGVSRIRWKFVKATGSREVANASVAYYKLQRLAVPQVSLYNGTGQIV